MIFILKYNCKLRSCCNHSHTHALSAKRHKKIQIHTADKSVDDLRWLMLPSCFALEKKTSENGTKACDSFAFGKCQCQNSVTSFYLLQSLIQYKFCIELEVFYLAVNSGQITFSCLISHIIMSDVFLENLGQCVSCSRTNQKRLRQQSSLISANVIHGMFQVWHYR